MMRKLAIVAGLAAALAWSGAALASKCDSGVAKAVGKEVGCRCGAYSKGFKKNLPPDFSKCTKFPAACAKAQGAGDCTTKFAASCASQQATADSGATTSCGGSPSGAFLE